MLSVLHQEGNKGFPSWSPQACDSFALLFDQQTASEAFQRDVAQALICGWNNNKDKPIWFWVRLHWLFTLSPYAKFSDQSWFWILSDIEELWSALCTIAEECETVTYFPTGGIKIQVEGVIPPFLASFIRRIMRRVSLLV